MHSPLITVVIPTFNRPQYLPEAVHSALDKAGDTIEVIVVPNGPDESWRQSLQPFANDARVVISPISEPSSNVARNHGLGLARGKFIRFLDDDDYLYPETALAQCEILEQEGSDVVSGNLEVIDSRSNAIIKTLKLPRTSDFCAGVLGPDRKCLPHMHVYRRDALGKTIWNLSTAVRQDVEWQFDLCASREWHWSKTDRVVGVWRQHWGYRVSRTTEYNIIRMKTVAMICRLYESLAQQDRLSEERRLAAAEGLWALVHSCFFLSPHYWSEVAVTADGIYPGIRPRAPVFHWPLIDNLPPLVLEWVLLPKRRLSHEIAMLARKLKLRHAW